MIAPPPGTHHYLKTQEVADHLHLHPSTIRRLVNSGRMPSVRFGFIIRIPRPAYLAYLDQNLIGRAD